MRKKNKKTTKKGGGRGTGRATPPIVADPQGSPAQRRAADMIGLRAGSAEAPSAKPKKKPRRPRRERKQDS